MKYIDIVFLLAGFVVLIAGYRRNHRNLLLLAAILLLLGGATGHIAHDFVMGFKSGFSSARSRG